MDIRVWLYERERKMLSRYATFSDRTIGREYPIEESPGRTEFMRDRDRIVHCASFRRLKDKTQVFINPAESQFRTRLTHTMEVSQISRTLARALELNEDLTEAIALGHDLGHTPFGHAGERALARHLPFAHNQQSLRIVEKLEGGKGLNLTFEVRDGILNHRRSTTPMTLEGMVVNICDKIAYINHDLDDAIQAGMLSMQELPKEPVAILGRTHGQRINTMIMDIVDHSIDKDVLTMSEAVSWATNELRSFLFSRVYRSEANLAEEQRIWRVIDLLMEYFCAHPEQLPALYQQNIPEDGLLVCVADYIAGMSDRSAVEMFHELFVPRSWTKL